MTEILLPTGDFSTVANLPFIAGRLGRADAHNVIKAHVSEQLEADSDEFLSVMVHEETHMRLFRTTSFGHAQQFFSQFSRALNSAGVPQVVMSPIEKIEAIMYETSWMVQEGAAVLMQCTVRNGFDNSLLDPRFFASLDARYANAATIFATAVGALTPMALAGLSQGVVMAVGRYCMNTDCATFFENYFQDFQKLNQKETARFYSYFASENANPQSRLLNLIDSLYQDTEDASVNRINQEFIAYCLDKGFSSQTDSGIKFEVKDNLTFMEVLAELERLVLKEIQTLVPTESFYFSDLAEVEKATRKFYRSVSSAFPGFEMVLQPA